VSFGLRVMSELVNIPRPDERHVQLNEQTIELFTLYLSLIRIRKDDAISNLFDSCTNQVLYYYTLKHFSYVNIAK